MIRKILFKMVFYLGICFLITACWYTEIQQYKEVTTAKINGSRKDYREWAFFLNYTYTVNDSIYQGSSATKVSGRYLKDFIGKNFTLVYSRMNPRKSILLTSPEDYKRWNIPFPDSLNWVRDKLKF